MTLRSDEKREYKGALAQHSFYRVLLTEGRLHHRTVSSRAARTVSNPLFAVTYFDRELRKDLANHVPGEVHASWHYQRFWTLPGGWWRLVFVGRNGFPRDSQYAKFCAYGFLKNLRFFEPFMVLFLLEQGISYIEIGTLYAVREISVNLLEIPTGAVADGIGRRRTMIASFGSYLTSFLLFWFGASMALFLPAMILFAAGEALRSGTHKAMIFAYLRLKGIHGHANDYYGHTRSWSQLGSALSALLAAAIVFGAGNYRSVFLFSMIPYILDLLLMITYPRQLDGSTGPVHLREVRSRFVALARGVRESARTPGAARSVLAAALFPGYFKGAKDYLQPMLAALALATPLATGLSGRRREAILIGLVYTGIFILTSRASRYSAAVSRGLRQSEVALNWELLLGLLSGLIAGGLRWMGLTVAPVLLFLALYLIHNLRKPVGVTVVAERVPQESLATLLSVESQLESLLAALVAFLIGAVAEVVGGNVGPGIAASACCCLALLPFVWLSRSGRSRYSAGR